MRRLAALLLVALAAACARNVAPPPAASGLVIPPVQLLDPAALADARRAARAGSDLAGLAELRGEAEALAAAVPTTVTDKAVVGPSGDPHDYVSLSIYWWPDPAKAGGLPYVQKDGQIDPESSDTSRYDAAKLNRMVGATETLALTAYLTGERRYAEAAGRWLRAWFLDERTRMNPSMRYAQIIPGRPEPRGTGIIDSRQLMRAIDAALLLAGTPAWSASDDEALRTWFGRLAEWLLTSPQGQLERAANNNHGTWYDAQLAAFGRYGRREGVAREALARVATTRVASQIAPDGTQPLELARTRSYHYSAFGLLAFAIAADLGAAAGVDVWHAEGARIHAAIDFLAHFATGDAVWPYPDIEAVDSFRELAPILARAARAYPDAGYARVLATLGAKASPASALRLRLGAFGALGGTAAAPAPLVGSA